MNEYEHDHWELSEHLLQCGVDPSMIAEMIMHKYDKWDLHTQKFPHKEFLDKVKNSLPMAERGVRTEHFVKLVTKKVITTGAPDLGYYLYKFYDRKGNLGVFFKQSNFDVEVGDCFLFKGTVVECENSQYDDNIMTTKFNRVLFISNYGTPDDE